MADKTISALTGASTPLAGTEVLPIVQSGATVKVSIANVTAGRAVSMLSGTITDSIATSVPLNINNNNAGTSAGTSVNFQFNGSTVGSVANQFDGADFNMLYRSNRFHRFFIGGVEYLKIVNADVTVNAGNLIIGTAGKGIDFSANGGDVLSQYDEGTWTPNQGNGLTVVGAFSSNGRYTRVGRLVTVSGTVTGATSIAVSAIGQICDNLPFTKAGASVSTGTAFSSSLTTSGVAAAGGAILYSLVALSGGAGIAFALTYEVA
jgi:hypothetical protein